LLTALAPLAGKAIELACPRKEDFGETRAGVANIVLTKKCLASFSLPILLSTVVQGVEKVWLNDEACVGCSWGVVRKWIVAIVETANRILAIFGQKPRLFTHRTSPELLERVPRERPVLWSDQPRYTRRDFFGALRRQAKGALLSIIAEELSLNGEVPVEEKLPQRLPTSRRLLAQILPLLGKPTMPRIEVEGLPFASIEIASNCAACGLCARLCPTGALAFSIEDGNFVLNFTLLHCLDCGICSLICPTESVAFAEQIETADLIDPSPKALLSGELAQCIQCGIPCAKAENETLCFVCRKRREWQALAG
jgi:ferredoxin